jgi:hypothetical protein
MNIILDDIILERVNKTKFLGVTIDENLTWKTHIVNISKNISKGTGIIYKLKHFVPQRILYSLYCTLILPYINYGILAWGNTSQIHLDKIMKLQKRVLRTISNSDYLSHSAPLFKRFNILNVHDTFKLELATFMYKHFDHQLPNAFNNYFTKHRDVHMYNTRNADDYNINQTKTNFAHKTIRTSGPIEWNKIDKNVKESKTIKQFRTQIKRNLISHYI